MSKVNTKRCQRRNEGMDRNKFPPKVLNLLSIPTIIGLALGIVGGLDLYSTKPSDHSDGVIYLKASSILYLAVFLALVLVNVWTFVFQRSVKDGERRLVFAAAITIPFFVVRILYAILSAFDRKSKYFSLVSVANKAVVVQACMSLLMEFIIVAIMLIAGLTTAPIPRESVKTRS